MTVGSNSFIVEWLAGGQIAAAEQRAQQAEAARQEAEAALSDLQARLALVEGERHHARGVLDALDHNFATIEFNLHGNVTQANANFLQTLGYTLGEVEGRHHRIFVDPVHAGTPEYSKSGATWQTAGRRTMPTAASPRAASRCGSRPSTRRCATRQAAW
jgi:PAS domain-containing protein